MGAFRNAANQVANTAADAAVAANEATNTLRWGAFLAAKIDYILDAFCDEKVGIRFKLEKDPKASGMFSGWSVSTTFEVREDPQVPPA